MVFSLNLGGCRRVALPATERHPLLGISMTAIDAPINIAPAEFLMQLGALERGVWGTPCAVVMHSGETHAVSLAWENRRFGDGGNWINPQDVSAVLACPSQMPARFARQIHDAGESGMGYHIYVVHLADGNSFVHVAGNLVIDLVDLPNGYTPQNITQVEVHAGRERSRTEGYRSVEKYTSVEYARRSGDAQ
jgi:hypothetical protein